MADENSPVDKRNALSKRNTKSPPRDYSLKKRVPSKPINRENDLYITKKTSFKVGLISFIPFLSHVLRTCEVDTYLQLIFIIVQFTGPIRKMLKPAAGRRERNYSTWFGCCDMPVY